MAGGWTGVNPAAWAGRNERVLTAIVRNSIQELANEASKTIPNGGRVPVKTGNLARSVVVSTTPPTIKQGPFAGAASLGVADIKLGDTVWVGWQSVYSARVNFGFVGADSLGRIYNQSGAGFAEATAAKWPSIVSVQIAKLKGR